MSVVNMSYPSSTKTLVLYWVMLITQWFYIGPTFWNDNGPILAASRWFIDSRWL